MTLANDHDPITKLPKLRNHADYILWKRRTYAYIRRSDAELLDLSDLAEGATASQRKRWLEASMRAKSTIILWLGDSPLSQTRTIVDDDERSGKELWEELKKIYTTSNNQTVLNIRHELDTLKYKEREDWYVHVNSFFSIIGKLAT